MMMNLTLERPVSHLEVRVIGVGGAGCSSLRNLNEFLPGNTRFLGIDTGSGAAGVRDFADAIRIGDGFGSGGDAVAAAELFVDSYESNEYREKVIRFVSGADVVIIVAGLGRGTGSGIAPLVAPIARESGALTLAAVNLPFEFEGRFRHKFAVQAIAGARPVERKRGHVARVGSQKRRFGGPRVGRRLGHSFLVSRGQSLAIHKPTPRSSQRFEAVA